MNLSELRNRVNILYNKYGDIAVLVDIKQDEDLDDTFYFDNNTNSISTENIQDITEVKDSEGKEVTGICLSNYIMEDNNWGVK